ncbi:MAG TPA: 50S ribosomal protein L24 [Syntrophorhabdaceae bacterium]|jgi:large subunit ribosomal protein L24|nr:50S ribosomal protein L24 [Syntrophorhabdaceae bacterium]MDI9560682.1 50S ribosomal protein L24 [Pseudomonadota bacterium]OQC50939.1 MAG: 50S ribosomal protein L24 [Deltaproteobacteria bacterium ADurb.Bin026]MBP8699341.1 50S ribosomal protein L24 [Syntrophorhabdaceae bacterium]MBV6506023.1 50S ribosomal protein L24 [Syntrophorhabdaceae bacterium]
MNKEYHVKKNDLVMVITGKDKGKTGKVMRINKKKDRLVVEKVNMVKRHVKQSQKTKGGIMEKEGMIHVSNVMIYCEKCSKPVRVGTRILEDGKKIRFCKKCNEAVDK